MLDRRAGCGHDAAGRPATAHRAPVSTRTAHRAVGGHLRMRYVFGDCTLDTELYVVQRTELTIPLRPKVFQVLHYLLRHRDCVIAKQELLEQVWPDQFVSDAALEGVLKAVRQAVGDSRRTQWCIQTRRGQGYRFVAPLVEPGGAPQPAEVPAVSPNPVPPEVRSQAPDGAAPAPDALAPSRRQLT